MHLLSTENNGRKKQVSNQKTNYLMDVWRQWQTNIMQRLVQAEDLASCVMENMWQPSMTVSERRQQ